MRAPPALRCHIFLHMDAVIALWKEVINLCHVTALRDGAVKDLLCSTERGSPKSCLLQEQPTLEGQRLLSRISLPLRNLEVESPSVAHTWRSTSSSLAVGICLN